MRNDCIFCGPVLIDMIDNEISTLADNRNFEFNMPDRGSAVWKYEDKSNLLGADLEWEIR